MTLQQILDNATQAARQDQHAQQEFREWILNEQAKVNDPKACSYSVFAQLVNISK